MLTAQCREVCGADVSRCLHQSQTLKTSTVEVCKKSIVLKRALIRKLVEVFVNS